MHCTTDFVYFLPKLGRGSFHDLFLLKIGRISQFEIDCFYFGNKNHICYLLCVAQFLRKSDTLFS